VPRRNIFRRPDFSKPKARPGRAANGADVDKIVKSKPRRKITQACVDEDAYERDAELAELEKAFLEEEKAQAWINELYIEELDADQREPPRGNHP
jgi:hypothetical protein